MLNPNLQCDGIWGSFRWSLALAEVMTVEPMTRLVPLGHDKGRRRKTAV